MTTYEAAYPANGTAALLDALMEAEGWKRDDGIRSLNITYVKDAHTEGAGFPIYIKKEPT